MSNKKEDKDMGIAAVAEEIGFIDMREQLAPKQVKAYVEHRGGEEGVVEYNNGTILVRSKHPLDECLRRGIIEDQHYDSGWRLKTLRDGAFWRLSGRIYNIVGAEGIGLDVATLYVITSRNMTRRQWRLLEIVCFAQADIDGLFFSEADYGALYGLGPNLQAAFEALDIAFADAVKVLRERMEKASEIKGV
jgi:hypothetical protein